MTDAYHVSTASWARMMEAETLYPGSSANHDSSRVKPSKNQVGDSWTPSGAYERVAPDKDVTIIRAGSGGMAQRSLIATRLACGVLRELGNQPWSSDRYFQGNSTTGLSLLVPQGKLGGDHLFGVIYNDVAQKLPGRDGKA